jgi:hypothetical protein
MECLNRKPLINAFADAVTCYFAAVDYLSNVVESNSGHYGEDYRRSFFEAHARVRYEFENCNQARVALMAHRTKRHSQVEP